MVTEVFDPGEPTMAPRTAGLPDAGYTTGLITVLNKRVSV